MRLDAVNSTPLIVRVEHVVVVEHVVLQAVERRQQVVEVDRAARSRGAAGHGDRMLGVGGRADAATLREPIRSAGWSGSSTSRRRGCRRASWCSTPAVNSSEYGQSGPFASGSGCVWPGNPLKAPSSLSCGMRSLFVSAHGRVPLVHWNGCTRCTMFRPICAGVAARAGLRSPSGRCRRDRRPRPSATRRASELEHVGLGKVARRAERARGLRLLAASSRGRDRRARRGSA